MLPPWGSSRALVYSALAMESAALAAAAPGRRRPRGPLRWALVTHNNDFAASGMIQNAYFLAEALLRLPQHVASLQLVCLEAKHDAARWMRGLLPDTPQWRLRYEPALNDPGAAREVGERYDVVLWTSRTPPRAAPVERALQACGVTVVSFDCGSMLMWHTREWLSDASPDDGHACLIERALDCEADAQWVIPYLGDPRKYKEYVRALLHRGAVPVHAVPHVWNLALLVADHAGLRAQAPPPQPAEAGALTPASPWEPPYAYLWRPPPPPSTNGARAPAQVVVIESQSPLKNAWLPSVIVDAALARVPGCVGSLVLYSTEDLPRADAMLRRLPRAHAVAQLRGRKMITDILRTVLTHDGPSVIVSVAPLHEDNYLFKEALALGVPLVTSSPLLAQHAAALPLHYSFWDAASPGADAEVNVGAGVDALLRAIDDAWSLSDDAKRAAVAAARAWLYERYDPTAPSVLKQLGDVVEATLERAPDADAPAVPGLVRAALSAALVTGPTAPGASDGLTEPARAALQAFAATHERGGAAAGC